MEPHRIIVDATRTPVLLRDAGGVAFMHPCLARAELAGAEPIDIDEGRAESGVDGLLVRAGGRGKPELRWHFQPRPAERSVAMWLELHNASGKPITAERLVVLSAPPQERAELAFEEPDAGTILRGELVEAVAPGATLPPGGTIASPVLVVRLRP